MRPSERIRQKKPLKDAVLIAGPTASGKSALALDIARRAGGVIVNADSMQVYSVLSVLTARPSPEVMRDVPHRLYGHVHPSESHSTGRWLREVEKLAGDGVFDTHMPVFVGGTGLYFKALTEGLAPMPEIPPGIRAYWRNRMAREGAEALHTLLARKDPDAAERIRPSDAQRIVRALEVVDASGRSITKWQREGAAPLVEAASARLVVIEPERAALHRRIEARFDRMIAEGALDEVKALLSLKLAPAMPAMKAIGVRELAGALAGETSIEAAIEKAKAVTRRYAKRQETWFRHQLSAEWTRVPASSGALSQADGRILSTRAEGGSPFFRA